MVSVVVVGLPIITMIGPVTRASTSPHFSCSVPLSWRLHRPHHQRVLSLSLSLSLSLEAEKKCFPQFFPSSNRPFLSWNGRGHCLLLGRFRELIFPSSAVRDWKLGNWTRGKKMTKQILEVGPKRCVTKVRIPVPTFQHLPPPPNNKKTWLKCSVNQSARPGEEEKLGKGRSTPCIVSDLLIRYRSGSRWQEMISSAPGRVINRGN